MNKNGRTARDQARADARDVQPDMNTVLGLVGGVDSKLAAGRIISAGGKGFQVLTESGRCLLARRAAACVLDPEAGDLALVFQSNEGAFILSVLVKAGNESTVSFPGDVRIKSPGKASFASKELEMSAVSGKMRFADLSVASSSLRLALDKASILARAVESTAESVIQRMGRCFRQVAETDTLRAGAVRRFVEGRFFQRSRNATILADEKVKMDADRIEMG